MTHESPNLSPSYPGLAFLAHKMIFFPPTARELSVVSVQGVP